MWAPYSKVFLTNSKLPHQSFFFATMKPTVAEGYNGSHARFSKFTGEIFDSDCNVQLQPRFNFSTAIRCFSFHNRVDIFNTQLRLKLSTAIVRFSTLNCDSNFQLRFSFSTLNFDSNFHPRFQLPTVILTSNRDSNFQPRFQLSTAIPRMLAIGKGATWRGQSLSINV